MILKNCCLYKVQEAASTLIQRLGHKGDLQQAEIFAQLILESLKDPGHGLDQNSDAVAIGYFDLAHAICKQEVDLVKAKALARGSLRIRTLLYNNDVPQLYVAYSADLLAGIIKAKGKLGLETRELLEHSLVINIIEFGPDGANNAVCTFNLGYLYYELASKERNTEKRKTLFRSAESNFQQAVRINSKTPGAIYDSRNLQVKSYLSIISREFQKAQINIPLIIKV